MSSYDLESALNEFISDAISNSGYWASEEHEHETSEEFEGKVEQYLGSNFTVGEGCRVQRAFEQSVRAIIAAFFDSDSHEDNLTRTLLRSIITSARKLPTDKSFTILASCESALLMALGEHESSLSASPESVSIP